jgi:hypothetical protein
MKHNTKEPLRHMKSTSSLTKDRRHDDCLEKEDYSSWSDLKLTIYASNNDKYLRENS